MASLHNISVQLSNGQKRNLARAYQRNEEVTLRLSKKKSRWFRYLESSCSSSKETAKE